MVVVNVYRTVCATPRLWYHLLHQASETLVGDSSFAPLGCASKIRAARMPNASLQLRPSPENCVTAHAVPKPCSAPRPYTAACVTTWNQPRASHS